MSAAKLKIPAAHIEAGLRQEPKDMPEEINRVLTDRISRYRFAPSRKGVENLAEEGIEDGVYLVGDVMYDVFLRMKPSFDDEIRDELGLEPERYLIMTLHRDFNVDRADRLESILRDVSEIATQMPVVFPIHPRTRKRVEEFSLSQLLEGVMVLPPLDYLSLMGLTQEAYAAITDSGGI